MQNKFEETGQSIYSFLGEVLVHCPRCDGFARIVIWPPDYKDHAKYQVDMMLIQKRLACSYCGYVKDTQPPPWNYRGQYRVPQDPYFGASLWLQISCCNELLWAYNEAHLDFLERFVAAD